MADAIAGVERARAEKQAEMQAVATADAEAADRRRLQRNTLTQAVAAADAKRRLASMRASGAAGEHRLQATMAKVQAATASLNQLAAEDQAAAKDMMLRELAAATAEAAAVPLALAPAPALERDEPVSLRHIALADDNPLRQPVSATEPEAARTVHAFLYGLAGATPDAVAAAERDRFRNMYPQADTATVERLAAASWEQTRAAAADPHMPTVSADVMALRLWQGSAAAAAAAAPGRAKASQQPPVLMPVYAHVYPDPASILGANTKDTSSNESSESGDALAVAETSSSSAVPPFLSHLSLSPHASGLPLIDSALRLTLYAGPRARHSAAAYRRAIDGSETHASLAAAAALAVAETGAHVPAGDGSAGAHAPPTLAPLAPSDVFFTGSFRLPYVSPAVLTSPAARQLLPLLPPPALVAAASGAGDETAVNLDSSWEGAAAMLASHATPASSPSPFLPQWADAGAVHVRVMVMRERRRRQNPRPTPLLPSTVWLETAQEYRPVSLPERAFDPLGLRALRSLDDDMMVYAVATGPAGVEHANAAVDEFQKAEAGAEATQRAAGVAGEDISKNLNINASSESKDAATSMTPTSDTTQSADVTPAPAVTTAATAAVTKPSRRAARELRDVTSQAIVRAPRGPLSLLVEALNEVFLDEAELEQQQPLFASDAAPMLASASASADESGGAGGNASAGCGTVSAGILGYQSARDGHLPSAAGIAASHRAPRVMSLQQVRVIARSDRRVMEKLARKLAPADLARVRAASSSAHGTRQNRSAIPTVTASGAVVRMDFSGLPIDSATDTGSSTGDNTCNSDGGDAPVVVYSNYAADALFWGTPEEFLGQRKLAHRLDAGSRTNAAVAPHAANTTSRGPAIGDAVAAGVVAPPLMSAMMNLQSGLSRRPWNAALVSTGDFASKKLAQKHPAPAQTPLVAAAPAAATAPAAAAAAAAAAPRGSPFLSFLTPTRVSAASAAAGAGVNANASVAAAAVTGTALGPAWMNPTLFTATAAKTAPHAAHSPASDAGPPTREPTAVARANAAFDMLKQSITSKKSGPAAVAPAAATESVVSSRAGLASAAAQTQAQVRTQSQSHAPPQAQPQKPVQVQTPSQGAQGVKASSSKSTTKQATKSGNAGAASATASASSSLKSSIQSIIGGSSGGAGTGKSVFANSFGSGSLGSGYGLSQHVRSMDKTPTQNEKDSKLNNKK